MSQLNIVIANIRFKSRYKLTRPDRKISNKNNKAQLIERPTANSPSTARVLVIGAELNAIINFLFNSISA